MVPRLFVTLVREIAVMVQPSVEARSRALFMRFWLPVLLYITAIGVVSAQPRLRPPVRFAHSDKIWHVLEYGLLGVLLARAFRATFTTARLATCSLLAVLCGTGVAAADERFQATVPGRISSVYDVAADSVGLILAQVAFAVWLSKRGKRT
jgi:VanZ family protein